MRRPPIDQILHELDSFEEQTNEILVLTKDVFKTQSLNDFSHILSKAIKKIQEMKLSIKYSKEIVLKL